MEGKVVLLTGGLNRCGTTVARRLHAAGARLMWQHRGVLTPAAKSIHAELSLARHDSVAMVQSDLAHESTAQSLIQQTLKSFGQLDAIIHNGAVLDIQDDAAERDILKVPQWLVHAAEPLRSRRASFLLICHRSERGRVQGSWYGDALQGLMRVLARQLAPEMRVNALIAGLVEADYRDLDDLARQRLLNASLLRRMADEQEIAELALSLLQTSHCTGNIIHCDGGQE